MCEWCESQYAAEDFYIQSDGLPMQIYNSNILAVLNDAGEVISWTEINVCPNCGRDLG